MSLGVKRVAEVRWDAAEMRGWQVLTALPWSSQIYAHLAIFWLRRRTIVTCTASPSVHTHQ